MDVKMKLNVRRQAGGLVGPTAASPGLAELEVEVTGADAAELERVAAIATDAAEAIAETIGVDALSVVRKEPSGPGQTEHTRVRTDR